MTYTDKQLQDRLNRATPGLAEARLGDNIYNIIAAFNALEAQYLALLAHLDTANVAGIGNTNAATYGAGVTAVPLPSTLSGPLV